MLVIKELVTDMFWLKLAYNPDITQRSSGESHAYIIYLVLQIH